MCRPPCSVVILSLLVACGDGLATSDAGDSGADVNETGLIAAPLDIPWLEMGAPPIAEPMLTPCPAGWHTVARPDGEDGPVTCHPYGGEPDVCPAGSAHFVGDEACTPVGAPCPAGDFPEGLPTDVEVLYVLASAPAGGDGSEGSPLMTITDAMNVASRGTVIAIGKGSYDEALRVGPGITLWGACARETRVTASSPGPLAQGILTVPSADVLLKNLRLGPANLPGVYVFGTRASVSIDGLLIEGAQQFGFLVNNGAHVDGRELSISGTRADATGGFGWGLGVGAGATAEVTRALFSGNRDAGVYASGGGTSVTLSDVVVEDTQEQVRDGTAGWGLAVQQGATAEVTRALFSGNRDVGTLVDGGGTSVTLSDVVIEDTQEQVSNDTSGQGLAVQAGATAEVARTLFSRNRSVGVFASGRGTSVTLSDVVVRDTQGQVSDGTAGGGLAVQTGATAEITRALFSRNRDTALFVANEGTSVTLSDVVVEDTQGHVSDGAHGRGLSLQTGATADVTRALFSGNRDVGVLVTDDGTSVTLSDVVVEETQEEERDGTGGRGLHVQSGATAEVTRALFSGNRDFGVLAVSPGTTARLSDAVVRQTDEQACAGTTCADRPFGVALAGASQASLVATRFEALDSALCGVLVQDDAQVDLSLGLVSGSPIGVCLQVDDYVIERLTGSVRYLNNGTNLDATRLPVPELASPVESAE